MCSLILSNAKIAGVDDAVSVLVDGGLIERLEPAGSAEGEIVDCTGLTLYPGFIDVHNHGAVGVDVNQADVDGLVEIAKFLATEGVTAWLPTLVPDSDDTYRRVIAAIDRLIEIQSGLPIAQALGVHYEGVFANEKMCGALRPEYFKRFSGTEVADIPTLKDGVHMTTFAPEIKGGVELAAELARRGWIASVGHTRADVDTLERAFAAGARHFTHFFNAMTGIHHRDIGVAGWALTNSEVTFDIIADGIHVNPRMLDLACRKKTPDKVLLISDSVAPTGLGDGEYELWGETVIVENKRTRNERGSIAGSVITMHDAVLGMRSIGFTSGETAKMASTNPARLLGVSSSRGSIEPGKRADIAAFDADGTIKFTMVGGRLVQGP